MESRVTDMTSGKPSKLILKFALPLMLGGVFQHLYTVVDAAIVGQFCGVNSLAALGSTDWLVWFCLGFCVGLTQGFAILIAQHFGAKEYRLLRKSVAMSIVLAAAIAVVMSVLLQILAEPVLRLLNTDPAVLDEALLYLRISYGGFAVVMAYNLLASVLRSLGDGTTPLVAMGVACAVNIGLDLLFVAAFHWGIGGAAGATVTAQLVSCLYCAYRFRKLSFREDQLAVLVLILALDTFRIPSLMGKIGRSVFKRILYGNGQRFAVLGQVQNPKLPRLLRIERLQRLVQRLLRPGGTAADGEKRIGRCSHSTDGSERMTVHFLPSLSSRKYPFL